MHDHLGRAGIDVDPENTRLTHQVPFDGSGIVFTVQISHTRNPLLLIGHRTPPFLRFLSKNSNVGYIVITYSLVVKGVDIIYCNCW